MLTFSLGNEVVSLPESVSKVVTWYEVKKGQNIMLVNDADYSIGVQFTKKLTGRTFVMFWDGDYRCLGVSRCHKDDVFIKKMGRRIAFGRALSCWEKFNHLQVPEEDIALIECSASYAYGDRIYSPDTYEIFYKDIIPKHAVPEWMYVSDGIRNRSLVLSKLLDGSLPTDPEELCKRMCVGRAEVDSLLEEFSRAQVR